MRDVAPLRHTPLGAIPFACAMLGIFLNQTLVLYGINTSIADLWAVFLILLLSLRRLVFVPLESALFFTVICVTGIVSAGVLVPTLIAVTADGRLIMAGFAKFAVTYVYFVIGCSIGRLGISHSSLRWFARGALASAMIGIALSFTTLGANARQTFFTGIRFQGFMNDPNYFAVTQVAAIAVLVGSAHRPNVAPLLPIAILASAVLLSGSRTGVIALAIYLIWVGFQRAFSRGRLPLMVALALTATVAFSAVDWATILTQTSTEIPAFGRVAGFFTSSSLVEASGRGVAWGNALQAISISPVFGIGFGSYQSVSESLWGVGLIAHNTYLQLAVEWGLLAAGLFFGYVIILIVKASDRKARTRVSCIARDVLVVLVLGGAALSLNNMRLFWFALGILLVGIRSGQEKKYAPHLRLRRAG